MKQRGAKIVNVKTALGAGLCGLAGLLAVIGPDRLVDGRYDREITRARDASVAKLVPSVNQGANEAASEHAWLTRLPIRIEPTVVVAGAAVAPSPLIASTVGARFTIGHAGAVQALEVVDVRDISSDGQFVASTAAAAGKLLLVSCKVVGDAPLADGAASIIRFIVESPTNGPTNGLPVRTPRQL